MFAQVKGSFTVSPTMGTGATPSEQSFALQYTSLILILLTCIVGTFIRPHLPQIQNEPIVPETLIGKTQYTDFFSEESEEINQDILQALTAIALNHDVHLDVTTFGIDAEPDRKIASALSRSVSLQRRLIDEGVPPEAFSVRASAKPQPMQMEVRIERFSHAHLERHNDTQ